MMRQGRIAVKCVALTLPWVCVNFLHDHKEPMDSSIG